MRISSLLAIAVLTTTAHAAQTVIPVAQFRSVELRNGGNVILRHGPAQRVTILTGSAQCSEIRVRDGQLVINNGARECRRHEGLQIEVVTPEITAVAVSNGGTMQSVGAFPVQAAIAADVEQGGTLDIRSIAADAVEASVYSGGRIFTNPRQTLAAAVESGGVITYWGDARVRRSVRDGGVVAKGKRADADRPLQELSPAIHAIPPIPPVPPIPALRHDR